MTHSTSSSSFTEVTDRDGNVIKVHVDYICPITLQVMVHPLMTISGHNYERDAILEWLEKGSGKCPLTRQPLSALDLVPNRSLESKIEAWRVACNVAKPDKNAKESSNKNFICFVPANRFNRILTPSMLRSELLSGSLSESLSPGQSPQRLESAVPSTHRSPRRARRHLLARILNSAADDLEGFEL
jgi:hypothetical protein